MAATLRPDQQDSQKGLQAAVRERQAVSPPCQTEVMRSLAVLVLVAALLSGCSAQSSKDPEATCWLKHAAISAENLVRSENPPAFGVRPILKPLPDCEALG